FGWLRQCATNSSHEPYFSGSIVFFSAALAYFLSEDRSDKARLLCGFFMKSPQGYESLRGGFLGRALSV
ncbi:hypothetical protein OAL42_02655, partial [Akkermansiaceae bacterium]|nr:hypothetical protein [Akkermansiaceae bacterium]